EIKDVSRPGIFKAYTAGIFASIKGKAWPMQPLDADLAAYSRYILMAPVWAGNPPPVVNDFLEILPSGKAVAVKMIAASGKSDCKERISKTIEAKGSSMESFEDIKA
ncbi:MAG: hypothetical protein FWF83_04485, partial [Clostridiales bacterium]|nr:hypothetical protein [Clostridiales bacterium]